MPLQDCCAREAAASLGRHRDVATCDGCGRLLLAYGDEQTYGLMVAELQKKGVAHQTGRQGSLWIVAKDRG